MTANVTVLIDQRQDVLKVPAAALRFRPEADKKVASADTGGQRAGDEGAARKTEGGGMPAHGSSTESNPSARHGGPQGGVTMRGGASGAGTITGGASDAGMKKKPPTVLWVLDAAGNPQPVPVETGISDGSFTEIVTESLKEGDSIIVGLKGAATSTGNDQVNPFAPRFPGGQRGSGTRRSG